MNKAWNRSAIDRAFDWTNNLIFTVLLVLIIYPLYFMVISSISDPDAVNAGQTFLLPKELSFEGYKRIFQQETLLTGFRNSFLYMILGTLIKVTLTTTAGYALSRRDLIGGSLFMLAIVFTMFFQGGMIPSYLLVKDMGLVNTIWAMVIPGAVSVYHLLITRTFFQTTIPQELFESASMDGCGNFIFFLRIVLPLSLPIIAVIALFSAVSEWNAYFQALIYLRDAELYPLQMILREILIQNQSSAMLEVSEGLLEQQKAAAQIKYGVVIVASVPMLILYPFVQKYFVKGVMVGSVKG